MSKPHPDCGDPERQIDLNELQAAMEWERERKKMSADERRAAWVSLANPAKFEYRTVCFGGAVDQDVLNSMGAEGWELVSIQRDSLFYFKRRYQ